MKLFFDTSSIAKYFHQESGSIDVINLVDDSGNKIFISQLTQVEFASVVSRRFRMGEIDAHDLLVIMSTFDSELPKWSIEPLQSLLAEQAEKLIRTYGQTSGLRSLDALQLSAFILLDEPNCEFVVADKNLNAIALSIGIKTRFIQ